MIFKKQSIIMKTRKLFLLSFLIFLIACNQNTDFKKSESGLLSKFYVQNSGTKATPNYIAEVNISYRIGDSVVYESSKMGKPLYLVIGKPLYPGDLNEALCMMSKGDSAEFLIDANNFFVNTLKFRHAPQGVTPESKVSVLIGLKNLLTQQERISLMEQERKKLQQSEPTFIQKLISDHHLTVDTLPSGLLISKDSIVKGSSPKVGDKILLHMSLTLPDGKVLFDTKMKGGPRPFEFGKKIENQGVGEAIALLTKGSKVTIVVPSKLAFGAEGREGFIAPFSPLMYQIQLVDIQTPEQVKAAEEAKIEKRKLAEKEDLAKFVAKENIKVSPTASGLYFISVKEGKGVRPVKNSKVKVHYIGYLLNGSKFDSSIDRGQPFEFTLGGGVIKGWEEGISMMKVGGKARLIIPSWLGYGAKGSGDKIPPYSTLVFDVELLNVQ